MIGIIDYGMGNLRSVENALDHLGLDHVISSDSQVRSEEHTSELQSPR